VRGACYFNYVRYASTLCLVLAASTIYPKATLAQVRKVVVLDFDDPEHTGLRQVLLDTISERSDVEIIVTSDVELTAKQSQWNINSQTDRNKLAKQLGIDAWITGKASEQWKAAIRIVGKKGEIIGEAAYKGTVKTDLLKDVSQNFWFTLGYRISEIAKADRNAWLAEQARQKSLAALRVVAQKKAEAREGEFQRQKQLIVDREQRRVNQLDEQRKLAVKKASERDEELARQKEIVKNRELAKQQELAQQQKLLLEQQEAAKRQQLAAQQPPAPTYGTVPMQQPQTSSNQYYGQQTATTPGYNTPQQTVSPTELYYGAQPPSPTGQASVQQPSTPPTNQYYTQPFSPATSATATPQPTPASSAYGQQQRVAPVAPTQQPAIAPQTATPNGSRSPSPSQAQHEAEQESSDEDCTVLSIRDTSNKGLLLSGLSLLLISIRLRRGRRVRAIHDYKT
jgi:hypothetical protein